MIIAVDVDGVTADLHSPWLEWYNQRWGDTLTGAHLTSWDIVSHVKPECGAAIFEFIESRAVYAPAAEYKVHPIAGALEGIAALREMGHRVIFATSANRFCAGAKLEWLAHHGFLKMKHGTLSPDYMEVHDKSLIRADVLIDDGVHNLAAFHEHRILFDQPWNRHAEGFPRCCTWNCVVATVEKYQRALKTA